jgi:Flp pilus assembly protein TadD
VEFLSLPPEEQRARYRAGVERTVERDPANVEAQVRYLELVIEDGKTAEAAAVARKIASLNPSPALTADAARALLAARQYGTLKEFIGRVGGGSSSELSVDVALADAHLVSAQSALEEMDRIPQAERNGDYYLARAEILEMAGEDPAAMLEQAMRQHPTRGDLYRETAALLIKDHRATEASRLLDEAISVLPDDAELAVMKNALKTSASN